MSLNYIYREKTKTFSLFFYGGIFMLHLTEDQIKEIVRAKFQGFAPYKIAEVMDITVPDVLQIVKEHEDYLEELGGKENVDEGN